MLGQLCDCTAYLLPDTPEAQLVPHAQHFRWVSSSAAAVAMDNEQQSVTSLVYALGAATQLVTQPCSAFAGQAMTQQHQQQQQQQRRRQRRQLQICTRLIRT